MPILFDHDPITGVAQYFDYDPLKDEVSLTSVQDVSGFLDHMNNLRNNEDYSKRGMKKDWWHYASIPAIVEIEMRKKGIDIYDKNATKAIIKEINENYPWLRATTKRHT